MIRCALSAVGLAAICVFATILYYEGLHLPLIGQAIDGAIAHRLEGYVALSEKEAADKKAQEAQRQAKAAAEALASANAEIASAKAAEAKATAEMETEIASYEAKLNAENRKCALSAGDVSTIVHNGAGKVAPVGHR